MYIQSTCKITYGCHFYCLIKLVHNKIQIKIQLRKDDTSLIDVSLSMLHVTAEHGKSRFSTSPVYLLISVVFSLSFSILALLSIYTSSLGMLLLSSLPVDFNISCESQIL